MKDQDLLSKLMEEEILEPGTSSEWTLDESGETKTTFSKKATATKAKPAPKAIESQDPETVYEIVEESVSNTQSVKKSVVGKSKPAPKR
jgi:hypothetical protein